MNTNRFDRLTRSVSTLLTRRSMATALALGTVGFADLTAAKKKRKKKKKVKFNDFGCVNVGGFCKNSSQCCSGICEGKKGKKKCKAHDQSTCQAGQVSAPCGAVSVECLSTTGQEGSCYTTTGNAGYCAATGTCATCAKDVDCEAIFGPGAACAPCASFCEEGTACLSVSEVM